MFVAFIAISVYSNAQLVANGNSGQATTSYTNGAPNNPIFIWCGTTLGATNGSLTATPTNLAGGPFTFEWFYHDQTTSSWASFNTTTGTSSTLNNLASDGYRVEIRNASGVTVNCFIAWVWNLNTVVTANATASGCNANLAGTVNTNGSFTYFNPPPPESIITNSTNITVCFSATHTYVSDLAFYLVGPASCGSPTIVLSPNPGAIGQGAVCNSGDNVSNLCFSRTSTNNLNICSAAVPLSGTYGTYGPSNTPINWNAFNGCNAAQGGWAVQIYDCIGADVGALTNATVTFSNLQSICGSPTTISYTSGAINSAINDNSCSAATASIFQVPVANNLVTPITLNATTTVQWTSSPAVSIAAPNTVNTTASGLPNGTTTFTLTATTSFGSASCVRSASSPVTVTAPTVNPIPNQTHCPGAAVPATAFSSTPAGATFTWTNNNTAIGLGASGSGSLPTFTAANATSAPITSTISVVPTLSGCVGPATTFTITVNPRPIVNAITPISQCGGNVSPGTFSSTPAGATFTWTNSNTGIGLGASGTGNIATFVGTNGGSTPITSTISVTPTLNGCVGSPVNFTITINPTPIISPVANVTLCHNQAATAVTPVVVPASATVSWTNNTTSIGLGASGTGTIPSFTANNTTSSVTTATITLNATAVGCNAVPVTYTITVNPLPTLNAITPISQCNGTTVPSTVFASTPSGATFAWSNSNTAIGLGANGTGNQPSFTATNTGATTISGNVSITPTLNGCVGTTGNYTISILPSPTVIVPTAATYCPNSPVPTSSFTTSPAGGTVSWSNSNTAIGLGASGTGNIPSFTSGVNNGTTTISGTITVTPTVAGCVGTPSSFTIGVFPTPTVDPIAPITICNSATVSATAFTSTPTGSTFTWSNSNTAIGLGANGTGNQPSFVATNNGSSVSSGTITVTPTLNGCIGNTGTYTITVNPTPLATVPTNITQCVGTVSPAAFTSTPNGATFAWTNTNTAIGLGASGTGNITAFQGTNTGSTPISGTVSVTPTLNSCVGAPVNFTITINPTPMIAAVSNIVDCENVTIPQTVFTVTPNTAAVNWTNSNTAIGLAGNGSGNVPSFVTTNNTLAAITGTVTATASENGCTSAPLTFDITVNQVPVADPMTDLTQCDNTTINTPAFSSTTPGVTYAWTNSNPTIGLGASGTGNLPAFTATNPTTTATSGLVTVTPSLGNCTGSSITFTINVNPVPVPVAQNNGPLCPGETLNLTSTGLPGATYSWTGPNQFASSTQNPSITGITNLNSGTYTVTVDAAGCIGTASTTLVLNPLIAPDITQVGPYCITDIDEQLVASIPGGTWSGNGIVNPSSGQFAPSSAGAGTHVITYTVNAPCALPATTSIVVNPLPVVNFSAPVLSGCEPFTATLTDLTVPASNNVSWNFGDGNNSSQTGSVSHTFNNVGCYDITLTSTSPEGCVNSLTLSNYICVHPYADAAFNTDDASHTVIDPSFQLFNNSSNATSYSWDFGDGTGSNEVNPTHTYPTEPGSYSIMLAANNQFGCPDTTYLSVVIEDQLIFYVPNAFTPDGDEHNNMFEPIFYSGFDPQSYTLLIFDRWGEIIFESHDVTQGWHGTYLDGTVKEGIYTWTIQFKVSSSDKKAVYRGHVTLLK